MDFLLPTFPLFCLIFVWLARPPWKAGLSISLFTLAAVAFSIGLIQWHRERMEKGLPRLFQETFTKAGMTEDQVKATSGALAVQSYEMNIEIQHITALCLGFSVILTGLVLIAVRKSGEGRAALALAERIRA